MIQTEDLCNALTANGGGILDNISFDQVETYLEIKAAIEQGDISKDEELQEQFIQFHDVRRGRITKKVQKLSFTWLEREKEAEELDPREITKELFGAHPKPSLRSHQFSFVTRLMNTVNESFPVFDKGVAELFGFDIPDGRRMNSLRRLNLFSEFYDYQQETYQQIINEGKLYDLLKVFEIKLKRKDAELSKEKRLDMMIRAAGEMKRKGSFIMPKQRKVSVWA
jgi:hypothetical protein